MVCAPAAPLPPGGTHRRECITGAFAPAYGFSFLQIYCGLWLILFPHPAPTNAQVLGLAKGYFQKWMNATKAEAAVREQKGQALVWVSQVLTLRNDGKMVARSSLPLARTAHWRLTPPPSRPSLATIPIMHPHVHSGLWRFARCCYGCFAEVAHVPCT